MFCMKVVKRINPKSTYNKENKFFFYLFNFVSVWVDGCSLTSLWSSFHGLCKSDHDAVHLKLI